MLDKIKGGERKSWRQYTWKLFDKL